MEGELAGKKRGRAEEMEGIKVRRERVSRGGCWQDSSSDGLTGKVVFRRHSSFDRRRSRTR